MNNLHFLNYNNYFNRIIKKENTIEAYDNYQMIILTNINFIPGDGLNAKQIINVSAVNINEDFTPDYLLVTDTANSSIISRWFVLRCEKSAKNQYILTLKRDIITDNYNSVIESPVFIEKATISDNSPLIYNNEQMSFNQIKQSEDLLKDYTGMPWVVGYVARNYSQMTNFKASNYYNKEYDTIEDYPFFAFLDHKIINENCPKIMIVPGKDEQTNANVVEEYKYRYFNINPEDDTVEIENGLSNGKMYNNNYYNIPFSSINSLRDRIASNVADLSISQQNLIYPIEGTDLVLENQLNEMLSENHKIIKVGTDYFEIIVTPYSNTATSGFYNVNSTADLYVKSVVNGILSPTNPNMKCCYTKYLGTTYIFGINQISINQEHEFNIDLSNSRNHCDTSAYDIFAMPYGTLKYEGITTSYRNSISMATGLGSISGVIYDLQLLPYCPIRNLNIDEYGNLSGLATEDISFIKYENINNYFVLWATTSNCTFDIPYTIDISNVKMQNETDTWRLCSPNYNGIFEFNAAKNLIPGSNRAVNLINVDCTFKPFTPYIHLNPDFANLYGQDFNDARGLICTGDFSLDIVSDNWLAYQIQNKNYQNQFNREIESMELQHKWDRAETIANSLGNAFTTAAMGGMAAGPIGAIAGTVIGLAQSGANYAEQETLYKDQLDLKKDLYGFQLDNIKALPNSLSKVSALNYNNKLFPFIEYYTCTNKEKEALRNKLYYNGMTVGVIGKIIDYQLLEKSFIKGRLIRLEGTNNDYAHIKEIANELELGLFI